MMMGKGHGRDEGHDIIGLQKSGIAMLCHWLCSDLKIENNMLILNRQCISMSFGCITM